ncbi:MAG: flagellar export chaperone FliS, partial [Acidobacteriaceae bacterium]
MNYQQQAIAGMNPVELIVALYDGMVRFLYQAIAAIEHRDAAERRRSIARVLEILMHLQSRLRMDVGGDSAKALAEFYTAILALCLEGS